MKFTVIIVLASVLASYVSFISALARPKLSASRVQMTIKMSNGMAAKIKTMAGLMTAGLVAVSTPAWGVPLPIIGKITEIQLPNKVKLTFTTRDPATLVLQCPSDASLPAQASVYAPGVKVKIPDPNVQANREKRLKAYKQLRGDNALLSQGYCTAKRVDVYLPDPAADPASGKLLLDPVFTSQGGNFQIYLNEDGFWRIF